jgi:hypothetical protein
MEIENDIVQYSGIYMLVDDSMFVHRFLKIYALHIIEPETS